jgi:hypothetical protein
VKLSAVVDGPMTSCEWIGEPPPAPALATDTKSPGYITLSNWNVPEVLPWMIHYEDDARQDTALGIDDASTFLFVQKCAGARESVDWCEGYTAVAEIDVQCLSGAVDYDGVIEGYAGLQVVVGGGRGRSKSSDQQESEEME